jgi:hypothetical protein
MSPHKSNFSRTFVMILALALGVFAVSAAAWSAQSETRQGAQVLSEVHAGKLTGTSLSETQYERVGQYLMSRAVGSSPRYEAMDLLMDQRMGQPVADRMYLYMGERFLGKKVTPTADFKGSYGWMANMMGRYGGAYAGMMRSYMMGAYDEASGTGSAPYVGMMGGYAAGRSGEGPETFGRSMMGSAHSASASSGSEWSTGALVAAALIGAALLGGVLTFAWSRVHRSGGRGTARPASR